MILFAKYSTLIIIKFYLKARGVLFWFSNILRLESKVASHMIVG